MAHFRVVAGIGYILSIHSTTFGGSTSNANAGRLISNYNFYHSSHHDPLILNFLKNAYLIFFYLN